jgi:hypothetical protein
MKVISFFNDFRLVFLTNQILKGKSWVHVDDHTALLKELQNGQRSEGNVIVLTVDPPDCTLEDLVRDFHALKTRPKTILVAQGDQTSEASLADLKSKADTVIAFGAAAQPAHDNIYYCTDDDYGDLLVEQIEILERRFRTDSDAAAQARVRQVSRVAFPPDRWSLCPHDPSHAALATGQKQPVFVCAHPGCNRPVQLCPGCGATNRSLARFCGNCGRPLDFDSQEELLYRGLRLEPNKLTNPATVSLSSYGFEGVHTARAMFGYLWIGGRNNRGEAQVLLTSQGATGRNIVVGNGRARDQVIGLSRFQFGSGNNDLALLITARSGVWRVDLQPPMQDSPGAPRGPRIDPSPVLLPSPGAEFSYPAIGIDGGAAGIEFDGDVFSVRAPGFQQAIGSFCSAMVPVGDRAFFYSDSNLMMLSRAAGLEEVPFRVLLDTDQDPVYNPSQGRIYVKGKAQVYWLRRDQHDWPLTGLGGNYTNYRFGMSREGDRVWIQDYRSLHCLNAFVGDPLYQSDKFNVPLPVSTIPPVDKEGMVFVVCASSASKRLAVVSLRHSGEPFLADRFQDILLPALFNMGSMFLIVQQDGQIFLKRYDLIR